MTPEWVSFEESAQTVKSAVLIFVSHTCLSSQPKFNDERWIRKLTVKWAQIVQNNREYLK